MGSTPIFGTTIGGLSAEPRALEHRIRGVPGIGLGHLPPARGGTRLGDLRGARPRARQQTAHGATGRRGPFPHRGHAAGDANPGPHPRTSTENSAAQPAWLSVKANRHVPGWSTRKPPRWRSATSTSEVRNCRSRMSPPGSVTAMRALRQPDPLNETTVSPPVTTYGGVSSTTRVASSTCAWSVHGPDRSTPPKNGRPQAATVRTPTPRSATSDFVAHLLCHADHGSWAERPPSTMRCPRAMTTTARR
jgi:hypothetical protein